MDKLADFMSRNSDELIRTNNYFCQFYTNGKIANIYRADDTVLVRIFYDEDNFKFNFAKKDAPREFGYVGYVIAKDKDLEEILSIMHEDAVELYEVICNVLC